MARHLFMNGIAMIILEKAKNALRSLVRRRANHMQNFHFVYIIKSQENSYVLYKGYTAKDVPERLADHNLGLNKSTKKHRPGEIAFYCAFPSKERALAFERYLKTASGIAFSRKRFL
jgi:predicted GIY-YIG superfamily endonuclease